MANNSNVGGMAPDSNWGALAGSNSTHVPKGVDMGGDFTTPVRIRKEAIRKAVLELFDDPDFVDQIQWKLALHEKPGSPKD